VKLSAFATELKLARTAAEKNQTFSKAFSACDRALIDPRRAFGRRRRLREPGRRALEAGFEDHLTKPVDVQQLEAVFAAAPGRMPSVSQSQ
jgi:hypothetical protein